MRALAATGICLGLAALAGGAQARDVSIYRGPCGEVVMPQGPTGLSSAVKIDTRCGTFAIGPHGVRFVGLRTPGPKFDRLLWRRGRLFFYERGRIAWRSAHRHSRRAMGSWVAADGRSLAFQYYRRPLHVADFDGTERAVGLIAEHPLGWTRTGLLVTWHGSTLRARTRSGRAVAYFATASNTPHRFDPRTRTLLFVSPSRDLVRTDGRRTQRLASVRPLRLGRWFEIMPLQDGRVALVGNRLVVLSADGSVVASDRRRGIVPAVSSHGAIATISTGPLDERSRARESVRLLRAGDRSSTLLFVNEVGALGCGHWPSLAWRGDDLLYSTTEGDVVVIDTGSNERIDLTAAVARLPGGGDSFTAAWA